MGVAEQPCRRVAEHLGRLRRIAIRALADREVAALALVALPAGNGERDHHAVADLQVLRLRADFHDFAHKFMAHDVAGFHAGHEAIEQMQVGPADCARAHLDDRVARVLDDRIGDGVVADVVFAVPAKCFHQNLL